MRDWLRRILPDPEKPLPKPMAFVVILFWLTFLVLVGLDAFGVYDFGMPE